MTHPLMRRTRTLAVYCDGSSLGNGKASACGGIGIYAGAGSPLNYAEGFVSSRESKVTNQNMELSAIATGLSRVLQNGLHNENRIVVYTDSQYSISCVTKWSKGWIKNGWKTANGKPVLNRELIERIMDLVRRTGATFVHVRSHRTAPPQDSAEYAVWYGNFQADKLATDAARIAKERASMSMSMS